MDKKFGILHVLGAIGAFATGFVLVSAISASAHNYVPADDAKLSTALPNPTVSSLVLANLGSERSYNWRTESVPVHQNPSWDAPIVSEVAPQDGGVIETCTETGRWCFITLVNGTSGWVDILNFAGDV